MSHLKSVDLGNTDTIHNKLSLTTFICPGQSFITRLDFQIYTFEGYSESPYPSGAIVYCSDGSGTRSINVWPPEAIAPGGKVDMVRGVHVAEGIRDVTASHRQYINSIGYAGGKTIAGRSEFGTQWSQVDPASHVRGCVLKGLTLVYVAWFDGARLLFDCDAVGRGPDNSATASISSTRSPKTTTILLELTAGLLAVFSVILTIFVLIHVFRANSQRSSKVEDMVASARARAGGYYKIVRPTQHIAIPVNHDGLVPHASGLRASLLASSNPHLLADDDEDEAEEQDLAVPLATTPMPTPSNRRYPFIGVGGGSRGVGNSARMVVVRPPDALFDDAESLYLPTSSHFVTDMDVDVDVDVDTIDGARKA